MSTINNTDQFLVQRNSSSFQANASDLMSTIQNSDLMLIQRGSNSYKVTCEDVKDQLGGGGGDLTQVNLAPLTGTPEFEVTATTNLSEIFPESVIHYQWYRYTASTGGTGTLVKSLNSDSAILDTYETTAADQNNYIGCTVSYLGTTVTETERTQCLIAPGPVATMYGLRFDGERSNGLSRSFDGSTVQTVSCWVKPTDLSTGFSIFGSSTSFYRWIINASGEVYINNRTTGANDFIYFDAGVVINEWTHLVCVTQEGAPYKVYKNGVEIAAESNNDAIPAVMPADSYVVGNQSDSSNTNGYLSELYVAEEALPPTVFGKNFEPYGWGPLDSSQIIENINNAPQISPYDTRANTDEVWSDSGDIAAWSNVFDGNTDNGIANTAGDKQAATWDIGSANAISGAVEIWLNNGTGTGWLTINGVAIDLSASGPNQGKWLTIPGVTELYSISLSQGSEWGSITAIKANGRLLVDQGLWNNSRNWSDGVTDDGGGTIRPTSNIFEGDLTENCATTTVGTSASLTVSDLGTITTSDTLEVYLTDSSSSDWQVSGANITNANIPGKQWNAITRTGTVSGFTITSIESNLRSNIAAIRLNGEILVDSGPQWNTSQVWSESIPNNFYYGTPQAIYNGNASNDADANASFRANTETTVFSGSLAASSLRIYVNTGSGGVVKVNGSSATASFTGDWGWAEVTGWTGPIASVTVTDVVDSSIAALEVDGVQLVDKASFGVNGFYLPFDPEAGIGVDASGNENNFTDQNFVLTGSGQDTVTDTPLLDYAVLTSGENGNLINTSTREPVTYFGEVGLTYYFEVNGVGATTEGGISFTSQIGSTYNFGQQPFVGDPAGMALLVQTWEQTKATLLKARAEGDEARISDLEAILIRQAVPFDRDTQYPKGTIVNIRGQLFEAIIDGADVSIADFVSSFFRVQSPEWINLDIKAPTEPSEEVSVD